MKNYKFKNIISLFLVTLLVWSSSINGVAASSVDDEVSTPTAVEEVDESETEKIEETTKAEEIPTDISKSTDGEDNNITETPNEDEQNIIVEEDKTDEVLKEEKQTTTVKFSFFILDDTNNEVPIMDIDIKGTVGEKLVAPFKDFEEIFGKVHSITGGDFKLEGDNLVGTVEDGLNVKIVFPFDEAFFDTSTYLIFIDEDGFPVVNAPEVSFDEEPGTVVTYNPPEISGYKYSGPTQFTIPDIDDENFGFVFVEYERIPLSLSVSHVDENGNSLKNENFEGKIGDFITINTNIPGYTFIGVENENSLQGNVYYSDDDFDFEEDEDFIEEEDSNLLAFLDFWFKDTEEVEEELEEDLEEELEIELEDGEYTNDGSFVEYEFGPSSETLVLKYRKNNTATKTNKTTTKTLPKTGIEKSYTTLAGITVLATGLYIYNFKKKKNI